MNDFPTVDGHTHVYKDHMAAGIVSSFTSLHKMEPQGVGEGTVGGVLHNMERCRMGYTVLANFAPLKSLPDVNEWTLSLGARHPGLIPLVSMHPGMAEDLPRLLEGYVKRGARGVKMHTCIQQFQPDDSRLHGLYEYCGAHRIPVVFHCGETSRVHINDLSDIERLCPLLAAYPGVPFVLTHMAAGEPGDVYRIAETYANAYFDTSVTITGKHCIKRIHNNYWEDDGNVREALTTIGCGRVLFGSDYPFGDPGSDIQRFLRLGLPRADIARVLGGNALALYGIA